MRVFLLTMLLTLKHAAPTVPLKAPDNPASTAKAEIQNADGQKSLRITELPSVSVTPSWRDNASLVFSLVLIIVTAIQAYLLYRTLKFVRIQSVIMRRQTRHIARQAQSMRYQTTHLKKSVEAATASANALINSERAWIDGELVRKDPLGIKRHAIKLTNYGKTPGRLLKYEVHYGPLTPGTLFSCERLDGYWSESLQGLIGSTATKELEQLIDIDSIFGDTPPFEVAALCITIRYGDVLTKDNSRKTSFVYHYESLVGLLKRMTEYDTYE